MYGAILGDIIGSTYEVHNVKTKDFPLFPYGSQFTDDTVLSVAVADQILHRTGSKIGTRKSCFYTHFNKEAIKGAEAVAISIFLARTGASKPSHSSFFRIRFL